MDDHDVVLVGLADLFDRYTDRIVIAEIDADKCSADQVDIVLYDSFAQPESDDAEIQLLLKSPSARRVGVYTWDFHPDLISSTRRQGVHGYLAKSLPARELVAALEAVPAGEFVVSDPPPRAPSVSGLNGPGRGEGLGDRESEILALITQGKSNADVAKLTYRSPNTVKSYIRDGLPKDQRQQSHPGGAVGCGKRFQPRPQSHRSLAWRPLIGSPESCLRERTAKARSLAAAHLPESIREQAYDQAAHTGVRAQARHQQTGPARWSFTCGGVDDRTR